MYWFAGIAADLDFTDIFRGSDQLRHPNNHLCIIIAWRKLRRLERYKRSGSTIEFQLKLPAFRVAGDANVGGAAEIEGACGADVLPLPFPVPDRLLIKRQGT